MTLRSLFLAATALTSLSGAAHADMTFAPVPFAADDAAKRIVTATTGARMDGADLAVTFHTLLRSGDTAGQGVFGALMTTDGQAIGQISHNPDFTSLLPKGDKLYSVSHFEEAPGALYLTELAMDAAGMITAVATRAINLVGIDGIWYPCAGSVTPWGTHLGSEEYPDDARAFEAAKELKDISEDAAPFARFYGLDPATMTVDAFKAVYSPYRYGFAPEISVSDAGEATVVKHYAMGRLSMELAKVMPDSKTAYITNDGTNTGLYRFVADKAGDLSSGQLFALKWVQTSAENGGAAMVEWVDLGHADDATIKAAIDKGLKFSDIFETADMTDGKCPEGFLASNAEGRLECLQLKPGMEMVASRLETSRYASLLGATAEFRKMEGAAYDPATNRLYVAMTDVGKGMTEANEKLDLPGRDDIRVAKNGCGAVYEMQLDAGFIGTGIKAVIVGKPMEYAADAPEAGNTCDVTGISSPDNLTFITGQNTLIIGEDTEGHQNDVIWAADMASMGLTRILSTPYGSEATSVDWYPNVMGHGYLMAVVQHPFGETDQDQMKTPDEANAYMGYIGPFPAK